MTEDDDLQADICRMNKLKELAGAGRIDLPSSYFNHLIDVYGDLGQTTVRRTFTDRERRRVDLFLESFTK